MLTLALLLATTPWPAGTVVLGTAGIDGTSTEVLALTPAGERHAVAIIPHAQGRMPKGLLLRDRLVLVVAPAGRADAVLEELPLARGARVLLAEHALAAVPPTVDDAGAVLFVRQAAPARFDVVRVGDGAVLTSVDAAWLQPARGRAGAFLLVEPSGGARVVELTPGGTRTIASIPTGSVRAPALVRTRVVAEVADAAPARGRARVVELSSGKVLAAGLAGMDPLPLDDDTVAFGAGTKGAAVVVDGANRRTLRAPRAGVAHPLAGALVQGRARVIAWLDRGASLPGELWAFDDAGAVRLLEPAAGVAVEVYGVVAP